MSLLVPAIICNSAHDVLPTEPGGYRGLVTILHATDEISEAMMSIRTRTRFPRPETAPENRSRGAAMALSPIRVRFQRLVSRRDGTSSCNRTDPYRLLRFRASGNAHTRKGSSICLASHASGRAPQDEATPGPDTGTGMAERRGRCRGGSHVVLPTTLNARHAVSP